MVPPTRPRPSVVAVACALLAAAPASAQAPVFPVSAVPVTVGAPRPVTVRVQWGGGQPRAWSGTVALVNSAAPARGEPEWRTLCTEPDAAAMVHADGDRIVVHQPRPVAADGVEFVAPDVHGWRIVAAIGPAGAEATSRIDVAVADLLVQETVQPLDADGNRLAVRPAPGEQLRATIDTEHGRDGGTACRPGERVRITVAPLLPVRADGTSPAELRLRLKSGADGAEVVAQTAALVPQPAPLDAEPVTAGIRRPTRFDPVVFDLVLPPREGAWRVELEAVEGGGLGRTRTVAARGIDLVTVSAERPVVDATQWRVIYELDPGSPRLHERLRRLPGVGLPRVPLPQVPLPSLTRPSLPRLPAVPLPQVPVPHVPLPQVPLPTLTAMVPRLSGLLAAGHSRVEPHPLGPMLQLPPAEGDDAPAWEGIVIAGAQPGVPHVVEIEYPRDQDAVVGATVLELDPSGSRVEARHSGGFEVRRADGADLDQPGMHRFVFWPATRHPVVLLSNRSRAASALLGHVRILAGPARLSPAAVATGRQVHAFLTDPTFGDFGGPGDHATRVAAVARSAEALAAQGAAGAMIVVHAEGAALWPSRCTREAPRWSGADDGPVVPDLLAAACRIYEREGLRLVPAFAFDAPLAALETQLARDGGAAAGITCVGRDGRTRRIGPLAVTHYNVLDPRVQRAVEDVVRELAGRLRGQAAVAGLALVLPHDGWLHLPGVAWGLDDATFARFRAAAGVEEASGGGDRFAARAALVEGPLRDRWLEWRAAEVARFHARLADVIAEHDDNWSLYVTPTTLCAEGPLADRLRPTLLPVPAADAVLREAGLDPVRSAAHRRVVFVAPHVHGGGGLAADATRAAGNAVVARAATGAARRGVLVLEAPLPLDVRSMVPHGPFGSAQAAGPCRVVAPATGVAAGRALAEAFTAADAEAVFDARLALAVPVARPVDRAALEALPATALAPLAGLPAPLVVRATRGDDVTWLHVVNGAGTPVRAVLVLAGGPADVMDVASGAGLDARSGTVAVDLDAWGMRALRVATPVTVTAARLEYDPQVAADVAARVSRLTRRRDTLEQPAPLDVLDSPGFELGGAAADGRSAGAALTGWEVVEPRRGTVTLVAGNGGTGRAAAFSSSNGLSTLRSNPFPPPASGRASVAAWLRVRDGDPQPPLRVALEGVRDDREYYRFAAVGGLTGGRPLTRDWQQFVLQVDDLPESGLESLRVRFDLLGPGAVEIDDVRVFDLAFAEAERGRLSRQIGALEAAVEAGDVGSSLVALDGYWPRFLEAHVPVPEAPTPPPATAASPPAKPVQRTGVLDRMWRLWQ
ncbi:MAG: hypothetical protein ACKOSQ_11140 [Planctomycetaceae bacterium]